MAPYFPGEATLVHGRADATGRGRGLGHALGQAGHARRRVGAAHHRQEGLWHSSVHGPSPVRSHARAPLGPLSSAHTVTLCIRGGGASARSTRTCRCPASQSATSDPRFVGFLFVWFLFVYRFARLSFCSFVVLFVCLPSPRRPCALTTHMLGRTLASLPSTRSTTASCASRTCAFPGKALTLGSRLRPGRPGLNRRRCPPRCMHAGPTC